MQRGEPVSRLELVLAFATVLLLLAVMVGAAVRQRLEDQGRLMESGTPYADQRAEPSDGLISSSFDWM